MIGRLVVVRAHEDGAEESRAGSNSPSLAQVGPRTKGGTTSCTTVQPTDAPSPQRPPVSRAGGWCFTSNRRGIGRAPCQKTRRGRGASGDADSRPVCRDGTAP